MTDILQLASLPEALRDAIRNEVRALCPRCDGGRSRELSLSIRQGEALTSLKCYRASCGWYAMVTTDPNAKFVSKPMKPVKIYRDETTSIHLSNIGASLKGNYGIQASMWDVHGWRVDARTECTLVMPVRDPYGGERGHVTRTFDTPKRCYTYKATAQPWLDWWGGDSDKVPPLIVVEDCLSACRLAGLGYNAVALLGTSITVPQAVEIASVARGGRTYLALDNDAFEKSLKLVKRHAHILQMTPILLTKDIKNIELDSDISRLFN